MKSKANICLTLSLLIVLTATPLSSLLTPMSSYQGFQSNIPEIAEDEQIDYLIITWRFWVDAMQPLANWKTQKGLTAKILSMDDVIYGYEGRDNQEKLKNCITDYYTNHDTKWVLLAGDNSHIPSRDALAIENHPGDGTTVSCDSYYADLTNTWNDDGDSYWAEEDDDTFDYDAEVYVGRLSANDQDEMDLLINKIINYETQPPEGDWMTNAIYGGTVLSYDIDWDGDDEPEYTRGDYHRFNTYLAELIENNTDAEITEHFLAETAGLSPTNGTMYPYNYSVTETKLVELMNEGAGFGSICGHGWPQGMVRTVFTNDNDGDGNVDYDKSIFEDGAPTGGDSISQSNALVTTGSALDSDAEKLGVYFLGGCSVGTFDNENGDCLTETFVKTIAISAIGGSNVVWGEDEWYEREHGGWYSEGLAYRFFEQLLENNHPGQAFALAKADYVADAQPNHFGEDPRHGWFPNWENKMLKQYNLMGDPEVPIWLEAAKNFTVSLDSGADTTQLLVEQVDTPLEDVLVTVTQENSLIWEGLTDAAGEIAIPYNETGLDQYNLTVYKEGFVPYQEINYVPTTNPADDDTTDDDTTDDDTTDGGIPGYSATWILGSVLIGSLWIFVRKSKK